MVEKTFSPCVAAGKPLLQINKNKKDTQVDEQLTFRKRTPTEPVNIWEASLVAQWQKCTCNAGLLV